MRFDRDVCRKFTSLTEDEIEYLFQYSANLQELADQSGSDVFLDCKSSTGHSAVVAAEAKPVEKGFSAYDRSLIGLIVPWKNEPAVERTFRLGIPTMGIKTDKTPGGRAVAQFVTPVFRQADLLGALIYEVLWTKAEPEENEPDEVDSDFDRLQEAVLLIDHDGVITYANHSARRLFRKIGYVEDLAGMKAENIWKESSEAPDRSESSTCYHEEIQKIGDFTLRGRMVPDRRRADGRILMLEDLTETENLRLQCEQQKVEEREFVHRMKNSIQLLSGTFEYKAQRCEDSAAGMIYHEAAARSASLLAGLGRRGDNHGNTDLYQRLTDQCRNISEMLSRSPIEMHGKSVWVPDDHAVVLSLAVNELVFNSIKYAYDDVKEGRIVVDLEPGDLYQSVTVSDYGHGFDTDRMSAGTGLRLVRQLVQERLNGDLEIESSPDGTRVTIRFLIV
jgi:two-component sensor histidine kinase